MFPNPARERSLPSAAEPLQLPGLCDITLEAASIEDPNGLLTERPSLPVLAKTKVKAGQAQHALGQGERFLLEMESLAGFRLAIPGLRELPLEVQCARELGQDVGSLAVRRVLEGHLQPGLGLSGMPGREEILPQVVGQVLVP